MDFEYWKISDFAKVVGKHINTVDSWFKKLEEEKKIHAVNRSKSGEKIYDKLDLEIANYIRDHRNKKWALDAIFNELPNHFELRPLSKEVELENTPQAFDLEIIKKEFETVVKQMAATHTEEINRLHDSFFKHLPPFQEIQQQYESLLKHLPKPKSEAERLQERLERMTDMITRRRIEVQLEAEALDLWSAKPEDERFVKVGWFRKEEDREKRNRFVKDYISQHFESRLKNEYGLQ